MFARCGLGLNSWQPTDVPLVEHARFSPRCAFLLRITGGRTFARGVVAGDLERRAQRSAHDMEELRTAIREFTDAIGILLILPTVSHLFISAVSRCKYSFCIAKQQRLKVVISTGISALRNYEYVPGPLEPCCS